MGMEFKDKILLRCFREVKCEKGFTTGTWYYLYSGLGITMNMSNSGLMVSKSIQKRLSGIVSWQVKVLITFSIFLMVLMKK